ncbi:GPR1/FUN34/yaaH family-domain-containing protein [Aspergillus lucknowensis]|uniref:GPR1/FUN34/yaaH family-domain-containing protein n=1 Tax=Aspergillus lucknowensis TaxID=176173 RepID=A0ABR4LRT7_9EURO
MTASRPQIQCGTDNIYADERRETYILGVSSEQLDETTPPSQRDTKQVSQQTFGSPTPIAIGGFVLCTTPLSMTLLGWRDAGGLGAANIGAYLYFGGVLLVFGGIGEWIIGNTFAATVFSLFGGFWFAFGMTLVPGSGAVEAYSPDPGNPGAGLRQPDFNATFAFFLVGMAVLCFIFCFVSIRTNLAFFLIFLILIPTCEQEPISDGRIQSDR